MCWSRATRNGRPTPALGTDAARATDLGDAEIVETVANVVANIFTNDLNHVADTDIDFPVRYAAAM